MKTIRYVLLSLSMILFALPTMHAISYKQFVYRRATPQDIFDVLRLMNDIEQSDAYQYLPLYPYTMRADFVDKRIADKAIFMATKPGDEAIAMVSVNFMTWNDFEKEITQSPLKDWKKQYASSDIFLTTDLWFTQAPYRNHAIFTTLLGFAFQSLVPRIKNYIKVATPIRVHCMVDFILDDGNTELYPQLIDLLELILDEFAHAVQKKYMPQSTKDIRYAFNTYDVTKDIYNPFAHTLEVALTRPAKRWIISATVE